MVVRLLQNQFELMHLIFRKLKQKVLVSYLILVQERIAEKSSNTALIYFRQLPCRKPDLKIGLAWKY